MENNIKIFSKDKTEQMDMECINRGFRGDIYVNLNDDYYQMAIYDTTRLKQDFDTEIETQGFFGIEPNVVLVPSVSLSEIKETLLKLHKQNFFEKLKPISKDELVLLQLLEI